LIAFCLCSLATRLPLTVFVDDPCSTTGPYFHLFASTDIYPLCETWRWSGMSHHCWPARSFSSQRRTSATLQA
jgi:hypothetical protein